ncbi:MAG: GTPase, partial [Planctomycetota bacterium]
MPGYAEPPALLGRPPGSADLPGGTPVIADERDTIVAAATPRAGGVRGVVRLSGPQTVEVLRPLVGGPLELRRPTRRPGASLEVVLAGAPRRAPCDVYLWPGRRSYTRQPSAELHTIGSPPLLDAIIAAVCGAGARLAEPGEFTLRALLAGRIDLTQAEAVLGVIDAPSGPALESALSQLAGGLSRPLQHIREDLLQLLAELEAGLDFVEEEDVRFIEDAELTRRLDAALAAVRSLLEQTATRGRSEFLPRVTLVGPPNAGKSSLFNALRQHAAADGRQQQAPGVTAANALVSPTAGTTRDSLTAEVTAGGVRFLLIDTAGVEPGPAAGVQTGPAGVADAASRRDAAAADLRVRCVPAGADPPAKTDPAELNIRTKC